MAVGQAALKLAPRLNIEYLTLDEYVEAFHAAVAAGQGDAFRRRFQNVDVLMIDDVQFLTNRKEMQSELLRLTEALQGAGHQIVLTSDRPPAEIADLDERLISRFSGGLVVDIGAPDYETRVAILRRKAEERGAKFQPGRVRAGGGRRLPERARADGRPEPSRRLPGGERIAAQRRKGRSSCSASRFRSSAARRRRRRRRMNSARSCTDVTATVGKAVEAWRARVGEAILRWAGEGYRTRRLEALLAQDAPAAVDEADRGVRGGRRAAEGARGRGRRPRPAGRGARHVSRPGAPGRRRGRGGHRAGGLGAAPAPRRHFRSRRSPSGRRTRWP